MTTTCGKCGKQHMSATGCPYCGHVNAPEPEVIDPARYGQMEYLIVGAEDNIVSGGRIDKAAMTKMLNKYAAEGWTVKTMTFGGSTTGLISGIDRDEVVIVLERIYKNIRTKTIEGQGTNVLDSV